MQALWHMSQSFFHAGSSMVVENRADTSLLTELEQFLFKL